MDKWKNKSSVQKANVISLIFALAVFSALSIFTIGAVIYFIVFEPSDGLVFLPLFFIPFIYLPLSLLIFIISWAITILYFKIRKQDVKR